MPNTWQMYCLRHGSIANGDQSERQDNCSALERALRCRRLTSTIETFFWQRLFFLREYWCLHHIPKQMNKFLTSTWKFGTGMLSCKQKRYYFLLLLYQPFFVDMIMSQFEIFKLRWEICSSVWGYDEDISTLWQKTTFKETNENSTAEEQRLKGEADALKAKPFFFKPGVKFTFLAIFALIDQGSFIKFLC